MKTSLKTVAYEVVRNRILNNEYKPLQIIDLNAISDELGISRTPVRDAITQLEQEELVTVIPRHGVMVTGISINRIYDISAARNLIEPYAARMAAANANIEVLNEFHKRFESESSDSMRADLEFHTYIASLTNNDYLIQIMNRILADNYRLVSLAASIPSRLSISNKEHLNIIDALVARDADAAEKAMRDHLINAETSSLVGVRISSQ